MQQHNTVEIGTTSHPSPEAEKKSLEALDQLEAELDALIKAKALAVDGAVKKQMQDRIAEDKHLVQNSGINRLVDGNKVPQANDSNSLKERQEKTDGIIKGIVINDQNQRAAILKKLQEIHGLRLNLLQEAIDKENKVIKNRAYNYYEQIMGEEKAKGKVTGRTPNSIDNSNKIGEKLNAQSTYQVGGKDGSIRVSRLSNDSYESNNPRALAAAMVAAGKDPIIFDGEDISLAIEAAEAALALGADVDLEESLKHKLHNESDPYFHYIDNIGTQKNLLARYNAIREHIEARNHARALPNTIFNKDNAERFLSLRAQTFYNHTPDTDGSKNMLKTLTLESQAILADELSTKTKSDGTAYTFWSGSGKERKELNAYDYIANNTEYNKGSFEKAYVKFKLNKDRVLENFIDAKETKEAIQSIDNELKGEQKLEALRDLAQMAANTINKEERLSVRKELYDKISNLPPLFQNPTDNIRFRNEIRAAAIDNTLERYFRANNKNGKYNDNPSQALNDNKSEIRKILEKTKGEEKKYVKAHSRLLDLETDANPSFRSDNERKHFKNLQKGAEEELDRSTTQSYLPSCFRNFFNSTDNKLADPGNDEKTRLVDNRKTLVKNESTEEDYITLTFSPTPTS